MAEYVYSRQLLTANEQRTARASRFKIEDGRCQGVGNVKGVAAEFNFSVDPEAAFVVLSGFQCRIKQIGWEVCQNSWLPWDWYEDWVSTPGKRGRLVKAVTVGYVGRLKNAAHPGFRACDLLVMAAPPNEDVVAKSEGVYACVELRGEVTRGQMVCDWRHKLQKKPNVDVVLELNMDRARLMFEQMLL
ncbi:PREDICTED: uncharacterized protein LOC106816675 [Priapulus caudatus]|uniref:Uncharacterized protein LOC106816675 n=1 Tax=Priapulus caudatus TaxID=37621 RepID=A0ABM1EX60_PRICU|nr:PREDICTED: uncharacterized protein LOC106816675 [Priapulus caudatus]